MKRPKNIIDTCDYVEPYTFENDAENTLFHAYLEAFKYIEFLEACREYDASGENRPAGYRLANHYTGMRQSNKD
jgi:hypothetical protein